MPTNSNNPNDRRINNFEMFEANLRNNNALSDDYLKDIERRGEEDSAELQRQGANISNIMRYVSELMEIQGGRMVGQGQVQWVDRDKKQKIEELANNIIRKEFGSLIDALDVTMDVKLVDDNDGLEQGADQMQVSPQELRIPKPKEEEEQEDTEEDNEESNENEEDNAPTKAVVTEEDILAEVDKRKLLNNIAQGSAKNVHRIIHLYRDEIDEIDPRLFEVMDKLIKSQESFEWDPNNELINNSQAGQIMKSMMNGYAKLEFDDESEDDNDSGYTATDGDEDNNDNNDETEINFEDMELEDFHGVTLKARAIDIVVLLHESVKVIYEMLISAGIPEDEEIAEIVMGNTDTLNDEFEDLRYGVYIRRDLLAFVSLNTGLQKIDNGFEYVIGRLAEIPALEFVPLFKSILLPEFREIKLRAKVRIAGDRFETITGTARQIIDLIIEFIHDEFDEYQKQLKEYEQSRLEDKEDSAREEWQNNDTSKDKVDETPKEVDYSTWSQKEIQAEIDDLLDAGDFKNPLLNKLQSFLK